MGFEGGFGFGAAKGEGEVTGGVFEAVEVEVEERIISTPDEGFYQGKACRGGVRCGRAPAGEELSLELALAPLGVRL